jgi:hypothetical protein
MVRTIRIRAKLPKRFWAECSRHARVVDARLIHGKKTKTPDELFDQKKPKFSDLHIFRCHGYAWIPAELRKKLDCKFTPSIYLGPMGKGHRMYDPITQKIFQASTVLFDEQSFGIEELINISKQLGVASSSFGNVLDEVDVNEAPQEWLQDMQAIFEQG